MPEQSVNHDGQSTALATASTSSHVTYGVQPIPDSADLGVRREPRTLVELFRACASGWVPDMRDPNQTKAFRLYVNTCFPMHGGSLDTAFEALAEAQKKVPDLGKEPFPSVRVTVSTLHYPKLSSLEALLARHSASLSPLYLAYTDIASQRDFWLGLRGHTRDGTHVPLFNSTLALTDEFGSSPVHPFPIDGQLSLFTRLKELHGKILDFRKRLQREGVDAPCLNQVLVDIVAVAGHRHETVREQLKSPSPLAKAQALLRANGMCSEFLQLLGLKGDLAAYVRRMRVSGVSGIGSPKVFARDVEGVLEELCSKATVDPSQRRTFVVRHLSLAESGCRGALGLDCSSNIYPAKAYEPPFHYFTVSTEKGGIIFSSGQVTIALGRAGYPIFRKPTGLCDKIQNIPFEDLNLVEEGVRLSLATRGYFLGMPRRLGDHNGISNDPLTRASIGRELSLPGRVVSTLPWFIPEQTPNDLSSPAGHSRAYKKLSVEILGALTDPRSPIFEVLAPVEEWRSSTLNFREMVTLTRDLRSGDRSAQFAYLAGMTILVREQSAPYSRELRELARGWAIDTNRDLKFRRAALESLLDLDPKGVPSLLLHFAPDIRSTLIQNWLQTPRYRKIVTTQASDFLLVIDGSRKVVQMLAGFLDGTTAVALCVGATTIPGGPPSAAVRELVLNLTRDRSIERAHFALAPGLTASEASVATSPLVCRRDLAWIIELSSPEHLRTLSRKVSCGERTIACLLHALASGLPRYRAPLRLGSTIQPVNLTPFVAIASFDTIERFGRALREMVGENAPASLDNILTPLYTLNTSAFLEDSLPHRNDLLGAAEAIISIDGWWENADYRRFVRHYLEHHPLTVEGTGRVLACTAESKKCAPSEASHIERLAHNGLDLFHPPHSHWQDASIVGPPRAHVYPAKADVIHTINLGQDLGVRVGVFPGSTDSFFLLAPSTASVAWFQGSKHTGTTTLQTKQMRYAFHVTPDRLIVHSDTHLVMLSHGARTEYKRLVLPLPGGRLLNRFSLGGIESIMGMGQNHLAVKFQLYPSEGIQVYRLEHRTLRSVGPFISSSQRIGLAAHPSGRLLTVGVDGVKMWRDGTFVDVVSVTGLRSLPPDARGDGFIWFNAPWRNGFVFSCCENGREVLLVDGDGVLSAHPHSHDQLIAVLGDESRTIVTTYREHNRHFLRWWTPFDETSHTDLGGARPIAACATGDGRLVCLLSDGTIKQFDTGREIHSQRSPGHPSAASRGAIREGGHIVRLKDGRVAVLTSISRLGLEPVTRVVTVDRSSIGEPLVLEGALREVVSLSGSQTAVTLEAASGKRTISVLRFP